MQKTIGARGLRNRKAQEAMEGFNVFRAAVALFLACFSAGCAGYDGDAELESFDTTSRALNPDPSCFNTPPASTFSGSGRVVTPATYNPSTCPVGT